MALNLGENVRLTIDTKQIFHEISAKLSFSRDFKEVATKDTNGKLVSPGSSGWSVSVDALWENDGATKEDLFSISTKAVAKAIHTITLGTGVSGDIIYSGNGYIEGFDMDATNEEYVSFSFTIKGSGDITVAQTV